MKDLRLSRDGQRLVLVLPDSAPMRAAARAVIGHSYAGKSDGHVVFTYPAMPDQAAELVAAFNPSIGGDYLDRIMGLVGQAMALEKAQELKDTDGQLAFDPLLRTTPMGHQVRAMRFCWARLTAGARGAALLMEQGTGKSLVAIGLANGLHAAGGIDHVLVSCPNSLRGTWASPEDGEVHTHSQQARTCAPRGTRDKRVDEARAFLQGSGALPWVVLNHEAFSVDHRRRPPAWLLALRDVAAKRQGLLVVDESSMLKNPTSKRTRTLQWLASHYRHVLLLTGTPVTRSPLDVWSQFEVMEPGSLGYKTYLAFERSYARYEKQFFGGARVTVVAGYQNLDDLERRVARHSYRARAADCLDLPPVRTQVVPVELSAEQCKVLRQLRRDMVAEVDGGMVDGRNVLARYLRMAQVVGGFLPVEGEEPRPFGENPKMTALRSVLDSALEDPEHKAVVFARFVPEIQAALAMAKEAGWAPAAFYGGVTGDAREAERQRFTRDPECRVLVAQYQTGSYGLNLTAASNIIFYSLDFSLEHLLQAQKRVHRKGQESSVLEVHLVGNATYRGRALHTIDHLLLQALRQKKDLADLVTGDRAREALEAL